MHTTPRTGWPLTLFRVPGQESASNARALALSAHAAGYEVSLVGYWPDGHTADPGETYLLEQDLGSAPRVSAFAFEQACGFSIDTLSLALHNLATEDITVEMLLTESVWHQRLRGTALRIYEQLRARGPSTIIIPHGAEIISRLIARIAQHLQYPHLYWESGFLPDHLYLDYRAPHFFRGLCSADIETPSPKAAHKGSLALNHWRTHKASKYAQTGQDNIAYRQWLSQSHLKTLFIAGQVPSDANVVTSLGHYDRLADLYQAVLTYLPEDWRVVFKPHPKDVSASHPMPNLDPSRFFVGDIAIHDAIETADAVLVHSSNVGLEAAMLRKPVIVTGSPVYLNTDLVQPLKRVENLASLLSDLAVPSEQDVSLALGHLLDTALLRHGDTQTLAVRIENARHNAQANPVDVLKWYPDKIQRLVPAAQNLGLALSRHNGLTVALSSLSPDDRNMLLPHFNAQDIAERVHGGPISPPRTVLPHPALNLGEKRKTPLIEVGLENRTAPKTYLARLARKHRTFRFTLPLHQQHETADIQSFNADSLATLLTALGHPFVAATFDQGSVATVVVGQKLKQIDRARFNDCYLPAQVFQYQDGTRVPEAGATELRLDVVHAHYGPYIELPAGRWSIRHPGHFKRLFYRLQRLLPARTRPSLTLEIVEHGEGDPKTILQTCWFNPISSFTAREGCKYDFRSSLSSSTKHKRLRNPKFNGFILSSQDRHQITRWISTP